MRSSFRSRYGDRGNNPGIPVPPPLYPSIDLPLKPRDDVLQHPSQKYFSFFHIYLENYWKNIHH